jgi:ATP-dependent Clp protease ATP-binding subunit ClpA
LFERFTERARQVVVLAQDEARALKHNYIGTEHILLGLLREEEGLAARVLESLDITVEEVRAQVARIVGQGDEVTTGQIPFTPRAKKVLELALREALSLGHNYIGTEHILLGLVRASDGVGARVLAGFGLDAERVRNGVIASLSRWPEPAERDPADIWYTPAWWARQNHGRETQDTASFTLEAELRPVARTPRDPPPIVGPEGEPMLLRGILIGWALASVTLGAGLLVGWLIWG